VHEDDGGLLGSVLRVSAHGALLSDIKERDFSAPP
jgi:hypothetical protein